MLTNHLEVNKSWMIMSFKNKFLINNLKKSYHLIPNKNKFRKQASHILSSRTRIK